MSLPVDEIFAPLCCALEQNQRVILQAPPGAGKSTRLPLLLLESGHYSSTKQIIILEPRRVAARQIAHFLASNLGEKVGQRIGLSMRGQNLTSDKTIVRIVTDGVMVRQLQSDPELENIGLVIFDEFHERALQTDLALALSLEVQELNEDIRILIMSATLDLSRLSEQLDAPVVESEGRQYPVDIQYCNASLVPNIDEIGSAVLLAVQEQRTSILVFLSGVGEIKRLQTWLESKLIDDLDIFPLYGGLSIDEQVSAIQPAEQGRRKIVLATNIAQTSLTIEGIDVVVDAGIERAVVFDDKIKSEQLQTQPISIASAIQRAGRAGRLRPGICYRLGSKEVFERRRAHDIAEIERVDLSQLLLELSIWGSKFEDLFWLSQPESSLLRQAEQNLQQLGYWQSTSTGYKNTPLVSHFQTFSLGLRYSKMLAFAKESGNKEILSTAVVLASLLEQSKAFVKANLVEAIEYLSAKEWQSLQSDIKRLAGRLPLDKVTRTSLNVDYLGLLLLWAYPDRIAKKTGKRWKMANGRSVEFHSNQVEPKADFIIVAAINASEYGHYVQAFAEVEYSLIVEQVDYLIEQKESTVWSEQKQSPQKREQTTIGQLIIEEKPLPLELSEQDWQHVWSSAVLQKGLTVFGQDDSITSLLNKIELVNQYLPASAYPKWNNELLLDDLSQQENWLSPYLGQIRKLSELKKLNVTNILLSGLDWELQQQLSKLCPDTYKTPAGNERKINYLGHQPKLSVKLQEMFGEPESPAICQGKVPLMLELLSPAQRPLQVTQDLANFWQNAYVEVKKEMKGRYPKHPWPDDPVSFIATTKTKRQLTGSNK